MQPQRRWWIPLCAMTLACQPPTGPEQGPHEPLLDEPADPPVVRSEVMPPPVSGGTLMVLDGGDRAVLADPDRDLVFVVDMTTGKTLHRVELSAGDEPGRLTADAQGLVHIAARRAGAVIDLDPDTGLVHGRRAVCPNPRGIAYDDATDQLHVACAGGQLVSLPAASGEPTRRVQVAPDLRDVVLTDEGLVVTRFRSAHVLRLDEDGAVVHEEGMPIRRRSLGHEVLIPNTAWRTIATPTGGWLMVHQASLEGAIKLTANPDDPEPPEEPGYGGGGGGGDGGSHCGPVVQSVLSRSEESFSAESSGLLAHTPLPVDVAISPDGGRIAIAAAGHRTQTDEAPSLVWVDGDSFQTDTETPCDEPHPLPVADGQYTAVTIDDRGRILAFSREPAMLVRLDPDNPGAPLRIHLDAPSRADTGHDLFHLDAGVEVTCATCHPEGGDDGHVWNFQDMGRRHTPSLAIELAGTAPFHWRGDLADMHALVEDVFVQRMGGHPLSDDWVGALEEYMFAIPAPEPSRAPGTTPAGQALFVEWGCTSCHDGAAVTHNENVSLGFEYTLQVPGLRGVAMHPPYMHDGRSEDLEEAVRDMVFRTRVGQAMPPDEEIAEVAAYLETL